MRDAGKQPLSPPRPRMKQPARESDAVLENGLSVGAQLRAREARGISGADDGADRGAGDGDRPHAQVVERFEHADMRKAARAAAAKGERDGLAAIEAHRKFSSAASVSAGASSIG